MFPAEKLDSEKPTKHAGTAASTVSPSAFWMLNLIDLQPSYSGGQTES